MNDPAPDCRSASSIELPPPPCLLEADRPSLFLDFDGTLVEIADAPDAIRIMPLLPDMLARLNAALGGGLAIVSGRAIADLERHLGPTGVAMAGSHGGEWRAAGSGRIEPLTEPLLPWVENDLRALAARLGNLLVEAKPSGMAVHYRNRPEAGAALVEAAEAIARDTGMTLKRGKMVAELVMPGADKGSAVARFMQMPGFAGTRPIFVGDDVTDEDAFKSVLEHDGGGILVGEQRETAALWHLSGVSAVHAWLEAGLA